MLCLHYWGFFTEVTTQEFDHTKCFAIKLLAWHVLVMPLLSKHDMLQNVLGDSAYKMMWKMQNVVALLQAEYINSL